jgi:hypothetical protein
MCSIRGGHHPERGRRFDLCHRGDQPFRAALVKQAGTVSHFQRAVLRIGNYLIALAVVLVLIQKCGTIKASQPTQTQAQPRERHAPSGLRRP